MIIELLLIETVIIELMLFSQTRATNAKKQEQYMDSVHNEPYCGMAVSLIKHY